MKQIQSTYGGGNITEPQLEQAFRDWLPVPSASCNARLDQFFPQWFDTAVPGGRREHDQQAEDHGTRPERHRLRLRAGLAGEPERARTAGTRALRR